MLNALEWVEKDQVGKVVICTDSAAVLASMRSFHSNSRQGLLYEILQLVTRIVSNGCKLHFLWVPAHVGVMGNEKADKMAKKALEKLEVEMNVSFSKAEVKSMIWDKVKIMWQEKWDNEVKGRHLYNIQESIRVKRIGSGNRKEEVVLTRLRLGHSALNKTLQVVGKHEDGLCEDCLVDETIEHVLMECSNYEIERESLRSKMRELGEQEITVKSLLRLENRKKMRVLSEFLRATGLCDRI